MRPTILKERWTTIHRRQELGRCHQRVPRRVLPEQALRSVKRMIAEEPGLTGVAFQMLTWEPWGSTLPGAGG